MAEIFKINDIDYECEFKLSNPDNQEIISALLQRWALNQRLVNVGLVSLPT
jgi:hypothetical protein